MARKIRWRSRRLVAIAGVLVPGVIAASAVAATQAGGATTPLQVKLVACGTGSSAVWNSALDPVLTSGTASAGECGAPSVVASNPAYAEADFTAATGGAVPTTEPAFTASAYSAGTPRMEIELNNGNTLVGYPGQALSGQTGPDTAGMAWAVGTSTTHTDYQTAYTAAAASSTTVKDAFIVEDASQPPAPRTR